jgi:tetratricopeptide (TPR) repeat protein
MDRARLQAVLDGTAPEEAMPVSLTAALNEITAALAEEGVEVRSEDDLDRALDERPALRQRLEEAVRIAVTDKATPPAPPPLVQTLLDFMQTPNWLESYRYLQAHPELLSNETDALSGQLIERYTNEGNEVVVGLLVEHRELLRRARAGGVARAFAEKLDVTAEQLEATDVEEIEAAIPPAMRQVLEEITATLRVEGVDISSPEELQAALAARPELVAGLEALDDAGEGGPIVPLRYNDDVQRADEAETRYLATSDPTALDEAAAAWDRVLNDAGFIAAAERFQLAALNNGGGVFLRRYWALGRMADLDRALTLWQDAVQRTPTDSPNRAMILNSLGNGLSDRYRRTGWVDDLDAAIAAYEDAVQRTPTDSPDRAGCLNNLGNGLRDRYKRTGRAKDLDAAIAAHEDAVRRTSADSLDRALDLNNLGAGMHARYVRTGRPEHLDAAIAVFEDAVQSTPTDSPDHAGRLNNLGNGLRDRYKRTGRANDLDAAIVAWQDAVRRTPVDSPDRAATLNNLGNGLRDRYAWTGQTEDLDAAIAAFEEAVRRSLDNSHDRATTLNNLGNGLSDRYARTKRAEDLDAVITAWQDAVQIIPSDSPDRATILNNLGNGLRDRYKRTEQSEDLDAAIAAWQDAARLILANSPDRTTIFNNLGDGLRDRYARTERAEDLDEAIASYETTIAALDEALVDSPVTFLLHQQTRWAGVYAQAAEAQLAAGRQAPALAAAESSKSRLLAGLMGRGELPAPTEIPAELTARERDLATQLNRFDAAELVRRGRSEEEERAVADRAAIVTGLRAAWAEMVALSPAAAGYVALRRGDRLTAAGLGQLAADLPPGSALLSLFTTDERTLLFLWGAGRAAPIAVEAGHDGAPLGDDELFYNFLANYEDEVLNRETTRDMDRPLSHRWRALGRSLLGPLLPHLDGVRRLIIAPVGVYHQLPLHALWLNDAGETLIDRCAISYVPALSLLARLQGREGRSNYAAPAGGAAVFGYTPNDDPVERALFLGEAAAVAERTSIAPRLDGNATGAALETATNDPLRLLHLSCHGYFDTDDALRSGVLLADGVYTARQFLARPLPADLVTLSACQTGISASLGGDEMAGLSLALLMAGARSLLLGLWSVDARTTEQMMVDFYDRLWSSSVPETDKAEVLRQTMLALRDGRLMPPQENFDPSDPYYWAPFVLVGDWR